MMIQSSPVITGVKIIPIARCDSMLLNIGGVYNAYSAHNVVVLTDDAGYAGIGGTPDGEVVYQTLIKTTPMTLGQEIARLNRVVQRAYKSDQAADSDTFGEDAWAFELHVNATAVLEAALLDLLDQTSNVPVYELLGPGKQHDAITALGYLFYVGDRARTDLPYLENMPGNHEWRQLRYQEAMGSGAVVCLAKASRGCYGSKDFKLRGGVLPGEQEIDIVRTLEKRFPDVWITVDPDGVWLLDEAISLCRGLDDIPTYVEGSHDAEQGFPDRGVITEFRRATDLSVATNMIATNWREMSHAVMLSAIDIPFADPRFWTLSGIVHVIQLCDDWRPTWGYHSSNHSSISLATFAHVDATAPGNPTAIDTHQIWQGGDCRLTKSPLKIKDERTAILDTPSLGVELDWKQI